MMVVVANRATKLGRQVRDEPAKARRAIVKALHDCGGVVAEAARRLDVSDDQFRIYCDRFGLRDELEKARAKAS